MTSFFLARFATFHSHSSILRKVSLSYFILVPVREYLGKHSCTSSPVFCSHSEWYLIFSRNETIKILEESPVKK